MVIADAEYSPSAGENELLRKVPFSCANTVVLHTAPCNFDLVPIGIACICGRLIPNHVQMFQVFCNFLEDLLNLAGLLHLVRAPASALAGILYTFPQIVRARCL